MHAYSCPTRLQGCRTDPSDAVADFRHMLSAVSGLPWVRVGEPKDCRPAEVHIDFEVSSRRPHHDFAAALLRLLEQLAHTPGVVFPSALAATLTRLLAHVECVGRADAEVRRSHSQNRAR